MTGHPGAAWSVQQAAIARCSLVGVPRLPPASVQDTGRKEPLARGSSESAHGASFTDDNLVMAHGVTVAQLVLIQSVLVQI